MKFKFNEDEWIHVSPLGEFKHAEAGVVQVVDAEGVAAIVDDFKAKAAVENFPGLLVDFDHFSMDTDKSSEAAGWITDLRSDDAGLWAKVRWTSKGKNAVEGGEYRLVSPVFPKASLCEQFGDTRIRPRSLLSVALTNDPNIKGGRPLTNRKHSLACATSSEPASECTCDCGGAQHGDGNLDGIDENAPETTPVKVAASSVRLNSRGTKFVSFTDENGLSRYLAEGDSEDGYEVLTVDPETGVSVIKTPSGQTVEVKTNDIPKKKEAPAAVPPGGAKVPPAKADPKKKLTGLQKWRLGEIERERKNEARKAAAKEKLKQVRDDLAAKRFKMTIGQSPDKAKSNGGVGKSFLRKAPVPKTRYYIDGAWYDGSGKFISRNKPATSLRNRSGGEEKLYKWVLGETKSGNHCPDCKARVGIIKTIAEWRAMGKPKCKCKCKLEPIASHSLTP